MKENSAICPRLAATVQAVAGRLTEQARCGEGCQSVAADDHRQRGQNGPGSFN